MILLRKGRVPSAAFLSIKRAKIVTSEDLAELDAFIQKLPLTEQEQKQTDMLFAHDATTTEFYITLGSYKNKNRRKVRPQLSSMQQDEAMDILKRLYVKVSKREGK